MQRKNRRRMQHDTSKSENPEDGGGFGGAALADCRRPGIHGMLRKELPADKQAEILRIIAELEEEG